MLVPSAAAERPSSVAAYFQITNGRGSPAAARMEVSQAMLPAAASSPRSPTSTSRPSARSDVGAAGGDRVGIGHGDDHPGDAGADQRLAAGAGTAGVVAGLQRDHGGAATGPLAGLRPGRRSRRAARPRTRGTPRRRPGRPGRAGRSRPPGWGWWRRGRVAAREIARTHRLVDGPARHRLPSSRSPVRAGESGRRGMGRGQAAADPGRHRRPGEPPALTVASGRPTRPVPRAVSHPDCLGVGRAAPQPSAQPRFHQVHRTAEPSPGRGLTTVGRGSPPVRNFTESRQRVVGMT